MKQIFENQYIKSFRFNSARELSDFTINQNIKNKITLENSYGDNYYCYIGYHSLTKEIKFIISFNSEEHEDNLNLLFWKKNNLLVVETGKIICFIDYKLNLKITLDITTPLIVLYLTLKNNLLILEEASLKLVNSTGTILRHELFDLIETFYIENDQLFICTSEGENKMFILDV